MELKHLKTNGDWEYRTTTWEPLGDLSAETEWRLSLDIPFGLNRSISSSELKFIREDRAWLKSIFDSEGALAMVWAKQSDIWTQLDFGTAWWDDDWFACSFQYPAIDLSQEAEVLPAQKWLPEVRREEWQAELTAFNENDCTYDHRYRTADWAPLTISVPDGLTYSVKGCLGEASLCESLKTFDTDYTNTIEDPMNPGSMISGLEYITFRFIQKWDSDHGLGNLHTDGWSPGTANCMAQCDAPEALFSFDVVNAGSAVPETFRVTSSARVQIAPGTVVTRDYKMYLLTAGVRIAERHTFDTNTGIDTVMNELLDYSVYDISPMVTMTTTEQAISTSSEFNLNVWDNLNSYAYKTVSDRYIHTVRNIHKIVFSWPIVICSESTAGSLFTFSYSARHTLKTDLRRTWSAPLYGEKLLDCLRRVYPVTCSIPEVSDIVLGDMSYQSTEDEPKKYTVEQILSALSCIGYAFKEKPDMTLEIVKLSDLLSSSHPFIAPEKWLVSKVNAQGEVSHWSLEELGDSDDFAGELFSEKTLTLFSASGATVEGRKYADRTKTLREFSSMLSGYKLYKAMNLGEREEGLVLFDSGNQGETYALNGRWTNARCAMRMEDAEAVWTRSVTWHWTGSPQSQTTTDIDGVTVNEGEPISASRQLFESGEFELTIPVRDGSVLFSELRLIKLGDELYFPLSLSCSEEPASVTVIALKYKRR